MVKLNAFNVVQGNSLVDGVYKLLESVLVTVHDKEESIKLPYATSKMSPLSTVL